MAKATLIAEFRNFKDRDEFCLQNNRIFEYKTTILKV